MFYFVKKGGKIRIWTKIVLEYTFAVLAVNHLLMYPLLLQLFMLPFGCFTGCSYSPQLICIDSKFYVMIGLCAVLFVFILSTQISNRMTLPDPVLRSTSMFTPRSAFSKLFHIAYPIFVLTMIVVLRQTSYRYAILWINFVILSVYMTQNMTIIDFPPYHR